MIVLRGEALAQETKTKVMPLKREAYQVLMGNIAKEDSKMTILFGLRRTGKTTMIFQAIEELGPEKCLYIYCQKENKDPDGKRKFDCISDVREVMEKAKEKYVFIDEATRLVDFVGGASVFPDLFIGKDRRVVVSGTESFGFILSKLAGDLTDRANFVKTTYIPFWEWNRLLGLDFDDYIKYGGTLSPEGTFYNNEVSIEYLDTAIVNNFLYPLQFLGPYNAPRKLYAALQNNELPTYIQKMIDMSNEKFLIEGTEDPSDLEELGYLQYDYNKSHHLGDLKDVLNRRGISTRPILEKEKEITEAFRKALRIHSKGDVLQDHLDKEMLRELKRYMIEIDMIAPKDLKAQSYYFVQPGMQYSQCKMLIEPLQDAQVDTSYNRMEWKQILEIHKTIARGRLMEDILFADLQRREAGQPGMEIYKYTREISENPKEPWELTRREFDIVLSNEQTMESVLFEVKNSKEQSPGQTEHLRSETFCRYFEQESGTSIQAKIVLYNGPSETVGDIYYQNAKEFLLRGHGQDYPFFLDQFFPALDLEEKEEVEGR